MTFPPGGSADIVIRALQPALSETLRQTIVIENRAGAGGNIGIGAVAKAAPDGYTLGVAAAGVLTVNPHLNPAAMPFDPLKDLAPVTMLAEIPFVLVARSSRPFLRSRTSSRRPRPNRKACRSAMAATARRCT